MKINKSQLAIAGLRFLSWFPLSILHGIGVVIGSILYLLPNNSKKIAQQNLDLCFAELAPQVRRQLLRQSLIESSKTLLEMGPMWFWPLTRMWKLDKGITGRENIDSIRAQGRGVIALTPHLGQWEFLGMLAQSIAPMTSLYRPPKLKEFDQFLIEARLRTGNTLAPTSTSGVKQLYKTLRKGQMTGILPDQDPGNSGVFAPFFGINANTMTLVHKLAKKTGAGIVIAYAERLPWGRGFITRIHPVNEQAILDKDPIKAASALNQAVEMCVREQPAQYQWTYKRFKKRPEGEQKLYN